MFSRNDSSYQRALVYLEVFFISATKNIIAVCAFFRDRHASTAVIPSGMTVLLPGRALPTSIPLALGTVDNWTAVQIVPFFRTRITNHIQAIVTSDVIIR